ncbi:MAG: VanZ family protein [Bacteroidetes bacterium]|nr:VanZ family protein [Bacteroidota bacterium]
MAWLWGLFIFILCTLPASAVPQNRWLTIPGADKWVHAFLFGWFALFLLLSVRGRQRYRFAALLSAAYGLLIECVQEFVFTWRSGDWLDWIADVGGIFLFLTVYWLYTRKS